MGFGVDATTSLVSLGIFAIRSMMNLISRQGNSDVLLAMGSGKLHYTN